MRDCIVVSQLPPPVHGSTLVTARLLQYLETRGERVRLVDRRFSRDVAEVGKVRVRKLLSAFSLISRFYTATRRPQATVIYFVTTRPGSFLIDWAALRLARRHLARHRKVAYVHTVGYVSLSERGRWWQRRVRQTLDCFDEVVVLGDTLGSDVGRWVSETRIRVIPNVAERILDRGRAQSETSLHAKRLHVLFLSNLLEEKGALDFLAIAQEVPQSQAEFRMAGHAGPPEFMGRVSRAISETEALVEYCGPVDAAQRAELLAWADIMVFPSTYRYEAQPLVIIEAFAAGVPVLAYDVGGVRDLVQHEMNGFLIEKSDVAGAVALLTFLDDVALARLSAGALTTHDKSHSPAAFERNWGALLDSTQASLDAQVKTRQ